MNGTQRILVTGAAGFLGQHIVEALALRGDQVVATDRDSGPAVEGVDWTSSDIRDYDRVAELVSQADLVIHNASVVHTKRNQEKLVWDVNLGGARNVLRACREAGGKKLVYISSASTVYEGRDIENGDERLPYSSISQAPYADSKIAAERELLAADGRDGMAVCALRPHVIFGPGDRRFLPALLARAREGKLRFSVGLRRKPSDFTYVSNVVDSVVAAMGALGEGGGARGQAFFITNGEPMPFFDFVDTVLQRLDLPKTQARVPYALAYAAASVREAVDTLRGGTLDNEKSLSRFTIRYLCTHHYFSIEKARRLLGYEPSVSVGEGIERTVRHLREEQCQ